MRTLRNKSIVFKINPRVVQIILVKKYSIDELRTLFFHEKIHVGKKVQIIGINRT